jgi:amino acid transporter
MTIEGIASIREDLAESSQATANQAPSMLSGRLGTMDIVFTVLAYNAPLTVVTGFLGLITSLGNGLGAPFTFLLAGSLMLVFAVGFAEMSKHVPNAGAFYAYITAGLGRAIGLGSALMAMAAYGFLMMGMYLYSGVAYSGLISSHFGASPVPWWAYSLFLLTLVAVLGHLKITFSAKILSVALACEVLLVICWELAVVATKGPGALSPSWVTPGAITSGSLGVALLLCVTSFAGFEATAVFREEASDPHKTIPRAAYGAILLLTVLFSSASYILICAYGPTEIISRAAADPSTVAIESIAHYLGWFGGEAVAVLLCTSVFACLLALHNILARYIYCLGVDGTFPRSWAGIHARHGSPYRASVIVTIVMLLAVVAIAGAGAEPYAGYGALTGVGGYALLLLLILTSLAVIAFFLRRGDRSKPWKTLIAPLASFSLLSVVGFLATRHMSLLTGNVKIATILISVVGATLVVGSLYAVRLKKTKPDVYRAIGRQKI